MRVSSVDIAKGATRARLWLPRRVILPAWLTVPGQVALVSMVTGVLDGFPELLWHIFGQSKSAVGTGEQGVLNTAHVTGTVLP